MLMKVCSLHGTDYNGPVAEAPLFDEFIEATNGKPYCEKLFCDTLRKVAPHAETEPDNLLYTMICRHASGEVLNRILITKPRLSGLSSNY